MCASTHTPCVAQLPWCSEQRGVARVHTRPAGSRHSTHLVLHARLAQVPPSLDFGFVPCKELQHLPLPVQNCGDVPVSRPVHSHTRTRGGCCSRHVCHMAPRACTRTRTCAARARPQVRVSWRLDPPFSISPQAGSLAPGECATYDVAFLPQEAGSFTGEARGQAFTYPRAGAAPAANAGLGCGLGPGRHAPELQLQQQGRFAGLRRLGCRSPLRAVRWRWWRGRASRQARALHCVRRALCRPSMHRVLRSALRAPQATPRACWTTARAPHAPWRALPSSRTCPWRCACAGVRGPLG